MNTPNGRVLEFKILVWKNVGGITKECYMRKFSLRFSMLLLWIVVTSAFAETADTQQIHKVYDQWTQAMEVAKGNPQPVVDLYAPKAILLATLAPQPLTNRQELNQYFEKLTAYKNMKVETKKIITQIYPNFAINSGVYVFHFIDKNNKPVALEARFSFVYYKIQGHWLIINHHSSVLPAPAQ